MSVKNKQLTEHLSCLSSRNALKHRGKQNLTKQNEHITKGKANLNSNPAYNYCGGRRKKTRNELPKEESFTLQGL